MRTLTHICNYICMKTYTSHKKGFIALFFTLSVSSILLVYVATSSMSVFDAVRARQRFFISREERVSTLQCADTYIDMLIRTLHHVSTISPDNCSISEIYITQTGQDSVDFSFMSSTVFVKGTIHQGFVRRIQYSNFSL